MSNQTTPISNILYRNTINPHKLQINGFLQETENQYLLKYFPKYYKSISLDIQPQHIISRIKRIKRIHQFHGVFTSSQSHLLWKNLLSSQRKDIKSLPATSYISTSPSKPLNLCQKKLRFFPNIRNVNVPGVISPQKLITNDKIIDCETKDLPISIIKKFLSPRIRSLSILIRDENFLQLTKFLRNLDSQAHFLDSLRILKIDIQNSREYYCAVLFDFPSLCSKITHLTFLSGLTTELYNKLHLLPLYAQRLLSLSIHFRSLPFQTSEQLKQDIDLQHSSFMASLAQFPVLKSLELCWAKNLLDLCTHFHPPSSLENLQITFLNSSFSDLFPEEEINWDDIAQSQAPNPFNGHKIYEDFCAKWSSLTRLLSFGLKFYSFSESPSVFKLFIMPILANKNLCLTSFSFLYSSHTEVYDDNFLDFLPFDPNSQEIQPLLTNLENLDLFINGKLLAEVKIQSSCFEHFKALKSLKFQGNHFWINQDNIKRLIQIIQGSKSEGDKGLDLINLQVKTKESIPETLSAIYEEKEDNIKIKLQFVITLGGKLAAKEIMEDLYEFLKAKGNRKGLSVEVRFNGKERGFERPLDLGELKEVAKKYPGVGEVCFEKWSFGSTEKCVVKYGKIMYQGTFKS